MPFTLTMPKLSPTMEEGTIAKWHVKEGEKVEAGALLMEVSTDKATVEHNALDEGYLRKILVQEGGSASVNQPIALFTEGKDDPFELPKQEEKPAPKQEEKLAPVAQAPAAVTFKPIPPPENIPFNFPTGAPPERIKASPLAKKVARERGLDLSTVKGTGPGGRIVESDLKLAKAGSVVNFGSREAPVYAAGSYEEVPMTEMRKVIGKRLQQAKSHIPHYYVTQAIRADKLVETRAQLKVGGIAVTFNDFVVRAAALALREHPGINCGINTETNSIVNFNTIDISVAVAIPDGLITPIVRYADYKNLGEISAEVKELGSRAHAGKLKPEEYQGGSFTISNLGMYGVTEFIAVINPPQAAILAVAGIRDEPVVEEGQVVPGKILRVTLSADHRIIDGAQAAEFLRTLKGLLENPALLLL
ncbi:MAG: pyruvate dehydrogenase complex dihydrolipoamide acetyltransferase [Chlamydiia bacterium]|nr:pyruvate dehydrogenase complex dihydrolipoamide acetyltransferase [Chlamydiia bacterium]